MTKDKRPSGHLQVAGDLGRHSPDARESKAAGRYWTGRGRPREVKASSLAGQSEQSGPSGLMDSKF